MTDERQLLAVMGKRIRILRLTRELTQQQVADAAGISRNFISLLERGSHSVDVVRLLRLAAALDVPLAELFSQEARPTNGSG